MAEATRLAGHSYEALHSCCGGKLDPAVMHMRHQHTLKGAARDQCCSPAWRPREAAISGRMLLLMQCHS